MDSATAPNVQPPKSTQARNSRSSLTPSVSSLTDEQRAEIEDARYELETALVAFLTRVKEGGLKALGRNPSSGDLVQDFRRYAWRVIQAKARDKVAAATSADEVSTIVYGCINRTVATICRQNGTWRLAVRRAAHAVDFGLWPGKHGLYGPSSVSHPKRLQLTALLHIDARKLIATFRPQMGKPVAKENPSVQFPRRAEWARAELYKRNWDAARVHRESKLDPKTIRRILKGDRVGESSLIAFIDALSKARNSSHLTRADVPDE
ncbi:MAG TPA: hypothetical protein VG714_07220 [Acidobacteriaceae bacterium]|nr:hypothetical protein [Acidobacteriaceae bacterium]